MKQLRGLLFLLVFLPLAAHSQLITSTALTPAQLVQNVLLGQGIQAFNITFTGYANAIGQFSALNTNLGIDSGIVLTTGTVLANDPQLGPGVGPQGNNTSSSAGGDNGAGSDPDLAAIATAGLFNAAVLEFDFIPLSDSVKFRYSFGSEEYSEFVNSTFNDVFGFFLTGVTTPLPTTNIALIPSTTTVVSINNVNNGLQAIATAPTTGPCTNCTYFRDNFQSSNLIDIQYDGQTTVLTAFYPVLCGETYHIKIAIADAGDGAFDSGVFLEAGSFSAGTINVSSEISYGGPNDSTLFEGCGQACLSFTRQGSLANADTVQLTFAGNAIPGIDFTPVLPSQIIFLPGQDSITICISATQDGIPEGLDTLQITAVVQSLCVASSTNSLTLYIGDFLPLDVDAGPDTALCNSQPLTITAIGSGGAQPYTYSWSSGQTTQAISVSPAVTTSYIVTMADPCGTPVAIDTVTVYLPTGGPLALSAPPDWDVCDGDIVSLVASSTGGSSPYIYTWVTASGPDSLPNINGTVNVFTPTASGIFIVQVQEGCGDIEQDTILVNYRECDVVPPNVFTPNGDGVNDALVFDGLENFPQSQLLIYNRWGNKIYESTDYRNDWNGDGVSDGTNYYILNTSDGKNYTGFVAILTQK
jgi:gliding motility-associated-like protein